MALAEFAAAFGCACKVRSGVWVIFFKPVAHSPYDVCRSGTVRSGPSGQQIIAFRMVADIILPLLAVLWRISSNLKIGEINIR